jgi:hypothetical protein
VNDPSQIDQLWDPSNGPIPDDFRKQLTHFVEDLNPKEDQKPFLQKELMKNQFEDKTLKNKLQDAQDACTSPYGGKTGITRE